MVWLRREDVEDRELRGLSRFATKSRDAGARRLGEAEDPLRTAFQRDRDRVIHSTAFRRLQHKTQVVAAFEGDHYRSRMTHSLEVSQMARGVATALALNADLAEAVALAHDLGHPPYGHVGEEALDELMTDHGGFRHNAQVARIVDRLEDRYRHGSGLNLTFAVRTSLLKGRVPDGFPIASDLAAWRARPDPTATPPPIEARVVDLCDKVAYLCHDLDDGLRAGAFAEPETAALGLWQDAVAVLRDEGQHEPVVGRVISKMVTLLITDLVRTLDRDLTAAAKHAATPAPRPRHSDKLTVRTAELLEFLRERFYRSDNVLSVMHAGQDEIRQAFAALTASPDRLPERLRARLDDDGVERTVCDYVAGMTDRFLRKGGWRR